MAIFTFDPEGVRVWCNNIIECLNGDFNSVKCCSKKLDEQLEILIQPNVWTGEAAYENYQKFLETHQSLLNFVNRFGIAFEESMNEISRGVVNLESISEDNKNNFGRLSFSQISELSMLNVKKDVVTYDYVQISNVCFTLKSILLELEAINNNMNKKLDELNNGSGIWDGEAAENAKQLLSSILKNNMKIVFDNLNCCINNISIAAENAKLVDRA